MIKNCEKGYTNHERLNNLFAKLSNEYENGNLSEETYIELAAVHVNLKDRLGKITQDKEALIDYKSKVKEVEEQYSKTTNKKPTVGNFFMFLGILSFLLIQINNDLANFIILASESCTIFAFMLLVISHFIKEIYSTRQDNELDNMKEDANNSTLRVQAIKKGTDEECKMTDELFDRYNSIINKRS